MKDFIFKMKIYRYLKSKGIKCALAYSNNSSKYEVSYFTRPETYARLNWELITNQ